MTKKLYAALTTALLGLAMSCGQAGEDVLGIQTGNTDTTPVVGVFAQFNAGGADPSAQKIDLARSANATPIIEFTNPEITSIEAWLESKGKTDYDFIADVEGLGPKWGGGGMKLNRNQIPQRAQ